MGMGDQTCFVWLWMDWNGMLSISSNRKTTYLIVFEGSLFLLIITITWYGFCPKKYAMGWIGQGERLVHNTTYTWIVISENDSIHSSKRNGVGRSHNLLMYNCCRSYALYLQIHSNRSESSFGFWSRYEFGRFDALFYKWIHLNQSNKNVSNHISWTRTLVSSRWRFCCDTRRYHSGSQYVSFFLSSLFLFFNQYII